MNPPDVNDVIAGKYQLLRILGRGAMGDVWLAHHKTLRETVAIKLLSPSLGAEGAEDRAHAARRFRLEAQVAARLSRKTRHIVQVIDYGEADGMAYLVMEALDGVPLETKLLRYDALLPAQVREVARQVSRALGHAHAEGILHRDLKPSNLMLTKDEDGRLLVKVLDFGIARIVHTDRASLAFATGRGVVCGTPGYMSPEQAWGHGNLDRRCDLWAFAAILYESLTNELPVAGATAAELLENTRLARVVPVTRYRSDLPSGVSAFFDCAFAGNVDARFARAADLAQAFEEALEGDAERCREILSAETLPSRPDPIAVEQAQGRPRRRPRTDHRLRATLGLAALLVGLTVFATVHLRGSRWAIRQTFARASIPAVEIAGPIERLPPPVDPASFFELAPLMPVAREPVSEGSPPLLHRQSTSAAPSHSLTTASRTPSAPSTPDLASSSSKTVGANPPAPRPTNPRTVPIDRSAVL